MKEQILKALPDNHPWRDSILWFDTIDSTNTQAKALAAAGAPHGTVLIADSQTGGRGRMGRQFHSPAGTGIYLSVILRPECTPDKLMHLTCACAVFARQAILEETDLDCGIKWINDLVIDKRKVGGILTELSLHASGAVQYAILGIGINCCQKAGDFPEDIAPIATSLSMESGRTVCRSHLAAQLILRFEEMSRQLLSRQDSIMDEYRSRCITLGQPISIQRFNTIRYAFAKDVAQDGALIAEFPDGHTEAVNAAEVSVRGMYGYAT